MEWGVRVTGLILRLLGLLLAPLWWSLRGRRPLVLPLDPWLMKTATEQARAVRSGQITSETLVRKYIHRIQQVNRYLNAVSDERFRAAVEDAKVVDRDIDAARREGKLEELFEGRPLLGMPFTVKESCSVAGLSNSVGCVESAGSRASADGGAVRLMRRAGAIPLLVSSTPELCLGWETSSVLRGATRNPHDLNCTPGGSSGGEAALLAAGASPLGVCSDIAGSIRVPAAFCGLFAHKPTPGIVPIDGHIPTLRDALFSKFLCVGPMTRSAGDLVLMMQVLAGERFRQLGMGEDLDVGGLRVYYQTEATLSISAEPVHDCIKKAILKSVEYLRDCGATIMEEKFPELEDSVDISVSLFFEMKDIPNMLQDPNDPKRTKSLFLEFLKLPFGGTTRTFQSLCFSLVQKTQLFIPEERRPVLKEKARKLTEKLVSRLSTTGVLIYPVFSSPAPALGSLPARSSGVMYSMLYNVIGACCSVVPAGEWQGMPVAVQIIAAPNQDRLCLAVAKILEKCFGGWKPPQ